jgi:hypothetical protein
MSFRDLEETWKILVRKCIPIYGRCICVDRRTQHFEMQVVMFIKCESPKDFYQVGPPCFTTLCFATRIWCLEISKCWCGPRLTGNWWRFSGLTSTWLPETCMGPGSELPASVCSETTGNTVALPCSPYSTVEPV